MRPTVVIHAGAGSRTSEMVGHDAEWEEALHSALARARAIVEDNGAAIDAVQAAVRFMEDEVEFFNAGRGSVLCGDGTVEMSAGLMRGSDRAAGAVAAVKRTRYPIAAAELVLQSDLVLLVGEQADAYAAEHGAEQRDPSYFITAWQQRRLRDRALEQAGATVGAVCLDAHGTLAAATSTGGIRGQTPGRVGDTPVIGAGTWADLDVAVSCTGKGEAFIRSGLARNVAALVHAGTPLADAAIRAMADVSDIGGDGGLIAVDVRGNATLPFITELMPRGLWRAGGETVVAIGPSEELDDAALSGD